MPAFPPQYVDLSCPRLETFLPPRRVTETSPAWQDRVIRLAHQPLVWYPAYFWSENSFKNIASTLSDIRPSNDSTSIPYVPIVLTVQGTIVRDRTDYRSFEAPQLADYRITRRIEYYLNGRTLITNIEFGVLSIPSSAVTVTYTSLADGVRLRALLRTNRPGETTTAPHVDVYSVQLIPGLHPHKQV